MYTKYTLISTYSKDVAVHIQLTGKAPGRVDDKDPKVGRK